MASRLVDSDLTTFTGDVVIQGNLQVPGDTTSTHVTNLAVEDKTITLASGSTGGNAGVDGAGLEVDVDGEDNKTFLYRSSDNTFQSYLPLGVASGSVTRPTWSFTEDSGENTGLYIPTGGQVSFVSGGEDALQYRRVGDEEKWFYYSNHSLDVMKRGTLNAQVTTDPYILTMVTFGSDGAYRIVAWVMTEDGGTTREGYFDQTVEVSGSGSIMAINDLLVNRENNVDSSVHSTPDKNFAYTVVGSTNAQDYTIRMWIMPVNSGVDLTSISVTTPTDTVAVP